MKRLKPLLPSHAIARWLSRPSGQGTSAIGEDGPVHAMGLGPSTRLPRLSWIRSSLAIVFALLAPWGGLCDRSSRPADPTTSRLERIRGPERDPQTVLRVPVPDSFLLGWDRDILDDEDSDEESETRSFDGEPQEFPSPTPRALGLRNSVQRPDDSRQPGHSLILRC